MHNPWQVGTAALAEVIKFNAGLREVSLANTLLNPQGCALLADALIMNRSLARLNLEKNRVGATGAQYLANALRANQGLRALFLDGNHIGDAGAIAISTALAADVGSKLEILSLSNTGITEEGAKALGDALEGNLCLKKLIMAKVELLPQVLQGREEAQGEARASSKGLQVPYAYRRKYLTKLSVPEVSTIISRITARRLSMSNIRRPWKTRPAGVLPVDRSLHSSS